MTKQGIEVVLVSEAMWGYVDMPSAASLDFLVMRSHSRPQTPKGWILEQRQELV